MSNDKKEFMTKLAGLSLLIPGFQITKEISVLYCNALEDLGFDRVCLAIDEIIKTRRGRDTFPSIRDIREKLEPQIDPEAEAIDICGRITEAISRIGPYRERDAREFVGEIGWALVLRDGGWRTVCEILDYENMATLKAQWRQAALGKIKRIKSGTDGEVLRAEDFLSDYERQQIEHRSKVLGQLETLRKDFF